METCNSLPPYDIMFMMVAFGGLGLMCVICAARLMWSITNDSIHGVNGSYRNRRR